MLNTWVTVIYMYRELLCHPGIKPALETLLGTNYRMDHSPDLMTADQGDDGHYLHGGNYEAFGAPATQPASLPACRSASRPPTQRVQRVQLFM